MAVDFLAVLRQGGRVVRSVIASLGGQPRSVDKVMRTLVSLFAGAERKGMSVRVYGLEKGRRAGLQSES